jgi:Pectinacetylesterase
MDETPHEPGRPDKDRRGRQNDRTGRDPMDGQPPPPDEDGEEADQEHPPPSPRGILSGGRRLAAAGVAVAVLLGGVMAFALDGGGDGGGDDDAADSDDTRSADPAAWEQIVPGGDCQCSDGSEFSFWVREANPNKVVFFLQDGGNCFSAETCAPDNGLYNTTITEGPDAGGVFDSADQRNPFADYSIVFVPYCTGDVHLGDATTEYAPGLTIQHKGYVNGTAALDQLVATFPGATDVVVMGESAGSVAAPLYAGLVSDRLPDAGITVLANGSGGTPDLPDDVSGRMMAAWGTANAIPAWPENTGLTAEQWSVPGLFIRSGQHDPEIVFARVDYAYDARQQLGFALFGAPEEDLVSVIDRNETQVEGAGVNLVSYIAPGTDHTALSDDAFYTETVNGEVLVDWVTRLIEGAPVADVHCADCTAG